MKENSAKLDLTGTGHCGSFNFRRTARAVTRLYDAALQESGIRSTQFAILVGIAKTQPVAIGKLGEVLVVDGTTLTRSLRLLKKEGLVAISEALHDAAAFFDDYAQGRKHACTQPACVARSA